MDVHPFEKVAELKIEGTLKSQLWQGLYDWDGMTNEWNNSKFSNIEVENINKSVERYLKIGLKSKRELEDNPVPNILVEKVNQFKHTMPVVAAMRNNCLKERHWKKINEFFDEPLDIQSDSFTLGSLMDLNALKYKEEISEISFKATKENELEELINKVKNI